MSFPKLLSRLFQNSGAGTMLNPEIIPTDTALSATSTYPVANKVVKAAIDAKTFPVDSAMSTTSTNAVQNKVVTAAINTSGYQVGDLRLYAGSDVPSGWFRCDGSTVTNMATNYPKLYAVLGTNVLPNSSGVCLQGAASGIGSTISSSLPNHYHAWGYNSGNNSGSFAATSATVSYTMPSIGGSRNWNGSGSGGSFTAGTTFSANMITSYPTTESGSVQPAALKVGVLIKHD